MSHMSENEIGIYVIHALRGGEAVRERVRKELDGYQFDFMSDGDISKFTDELMSQYFCPNIKAILSDGPTSCALNHFLACEKIAQRKCRYAIVFEDDIYLEPNFDRELQAIIAEIDQQDLHGYLISLENTTLRFPSYKQKIRGKRLHKASVGRTAGAYMLDWECAAKIVEYTHQNKCDDPLDWWHNVLARNNVMQIFWTHPTITEQGSHNGKSESILDSKRNRSLVRRFKWLTKKYYKLIVRRLFRESYVFE